MLKRKPKHPHRRVSRTDPDAGWLNRANKPHGMYYLSHQTLDADHGIILDVTVTAGDASDKTPYLGQRERVPPGRRIPQGALPVSSRQRLLPLPQWKSAYPDQGEQERGQRPALGL